MTNEWYVEKPLKKYYIIIEFQAEAKDMDHAREISAEIAEEFRDETGDACRVLSVSDKPKEDV